MYFFEIPTFTIPLPTKINIESVTGFSTNSAQHQPNKCFFELYKDKIRTKSESYNSQNQIIRKVSFDEKGMVSEEVFYNDDASLNYKLKYEYNDKHILTRQLMYLSDGSLWLTYKITHNTLGQIDHIVIENKGGTVIKTSNYFYSEQGTLEKIDMGSMGTFEYNYDPQQKLVAVSLFTPSASRNGDHFQLLYDTESLLNKIIYNNDEITLFEYSFEQ
jgi:hypothetical protein